MGHGNARLCTVIYEIDYAKTYIFSLISYLTRTQVYVYL